MYSDSFLQVIDEPFSMCYLQGELQTRVSMDRNAFIPGDQAAIFYEVRGSVMLRSCCV